MVNSRSNCDGNILSLQDIETSEGEASPLKDKPRACASVGHGLSLC